MPLCSCSSVRGGEGGAEVMEGGGGGARLVDVDDEFFYGLQRHVVLFFVPAAAAGSVRAAAASQWQCNRRMACVTYSTRGRLMDNSKPSRLIVSIKTPICSSPRPPTSYASRASLCFTVIATFLSASFISRSPSMHRSVTCHAIVSHVTQ